MLPTLFSPSIKEYRNLTFLQYPTIANAPLPAEGSGNDSWSNTLMFGLLLGVPYYLKYKVGGGFKTFIFFALVVDLPILVGFWVVMSTYSPRKNEKVKLPGKGVEHYLQFHKQEDAVKYRGNTKIPMEVFYEMYFEGDVSFKGDCFEILEHRHDWATFQFTMGLFKHFLFGMVPELLVHSRSQGENLNFIIRL